jgi:LysR family transcriptional regulator, nitrogen assimilation regulatory protein
MQLRHLRYFVKIVEAGSFSRAAATIHVAQPALSQQIAELEEQLGVSLLLRTARGVRVTPAGEALYGEASSILRQVELLPDVVRSSGEEATGTVAVGMSSTLAGQFAGTLMEASKAALPKVMMKFASADSLSLKRRIETHTLDLAVVFEDYLDARLLREPIFGQRLFYVSREGSAEPKASVRLDDLAKLPLVLPSMPNGLRAMLDRVFSSSKIVPNMVAEADVFSSLLAAVGQGIGGTVLPTSEVSDAHGGPLVAVPIVDPPLYMTASVVWSNDFPLTRAGEAVRQLLVSFLKGNVVANPTTGLELLHG